MELKQRIVSKCILILGLGLTIASLLLDIIEIAPIGGSLVGAWIALEMTTIEVERLQKRNRYLEKTILDVFNEAGKLRKELRMKGQDGQTSNN